MTCQAKHTKYQPDDSEWNCPKCGSKLDEGMFILEEWDEDADEDCKLLHDNDTIRCHACENEWTGKSLAAAFVKKNNLVKCPHCKGTGMVKR